VRHIAFVSAFLAILVPATVIAGVHVAHVAPRVVFIPGTTTTVQAASPRPFDLVVRAVNYAPDKTITSQLSVFSPFQRLADAEFAVPNAVVLDADVPADSQPEASATDTPLTAGTVLYASVGDQTMYCTGAKSISLTHAGATCLVDLENDRHFDEVVKGGNPTWAPDALAMSVDDPANPHKTHSEALVLGKRMLLPAPIPYHVADASKIPSLQGQIVWASDYKSDEQKGPIHLMFAYSLPVHGSGGTLLWTKKVMYAGTPMEVDLNGVKIAIESIGPDGELVCRISEQPSPSPVQFWHYQNPRPIF